MNSDCRVPPRPLAWATFNAAAAHAIEGQIKPWLPRGLEFSCSLELRLPPAPEGGLQGRRRRGRLFAFPCFFPKPGSLIGAWPRHRARGRGGEQPAQAGKQGCFPQGSVFLGAALPGAREQQRVFR